MKAQVIKIMGKDIVSKLDDGSLVKCDCLGNVKKQGKLLVGDYVEVAKNLGTSDRYIISKIYPRINQMLRPPLANLNQLIIVLSVKPKPDFYLVDKLIIYCIKNNISVSLLVNKLDIMTNKQMLDIVDQYKTVVNSIMFASALTGDNIADLKEMLKGKISAFVGQSAVGKSSLLNAINPNLMLKTNVLSRKVERGKHTTRHCEIYTLENDIHIADTPGFSMLDILDIAPQNLKDYYLDFTPFAEDCEYADCNHISNKGKNCEVINAVEKKKLNKNRYLRYVELYKKLDEKWRRKYD